MLALVLMAPKTNGSALTRSVVKILVKDQHAWSHAYRIAQYLNTRNGTVSNILNRLERKGWLESRWETRRKLFRPTENGMTEFKMLIWGNSPDREGEK